MTLLRSAHFGSDVERIPFELGVAAGMFKGARAFRKFGRNPTTNGTEDIWAFGGVRVAPTAAGVVSLVSSDAADTLLGTGAQIVVVQGLDADYNEIAENVEMSGTTPAVTTAEFLRVFRMFVAHVGSGEVNAGNITATIGGDVQAYISAGDGQTAIAHYTVPADHILVVDYYSVGVGRMAGTADANIKAQIRAYDPTSNNNYQSWRSISNLQLYNGQEHVNSKSVTILPARTDLRVQCVSSAATQAHAIYGGYLINPRLANT